MEEAALQLTAARQHVRVGGRGAGAAAPAARRPPPPPPPCACALGSPRRGLGDSRRAPRCSRTPSQAHRRGPQRGEGRKGGRAPRRSRPEWGEMAAGGYPLCLRAHLPAACRGGAGLARGREMETEIRDGDGEREATTALPGPRGAGELPEVRPEAWPCARGHLPGAAAASRLLHTQPPQPAASVERLCFPPALCPEEFSGAVLQPFRG